MNKRQELENQKNYPRTKILIAMILFGTMSIAVRGAGLPSSVLALFRAAIGGMSIIIFSFLKGNRIDFSAIRQNFRLLFLSGIMLGFGWVLLFEAYNYVSVATATLCYYMQPVILILVSPLFLKEKLTQKKVFCAVLALFGMTLVSGVFEGGLSGGSWHGIMLALGAAVLYVAIIIFNKRIESISSFDRVAAQLLLSIPALLLYVLINHQFRNVEVTMASAVWVAITGVLYTGVTYMLFYGSLPYVSSQTAAILSYVDPAVAVLVSVIFFGEPMTFLMASGALLILGAALISELKIR